MGDSLNINSVGLWRLATTPSSSSSSSSVPSNIKLAPPNSSIAIIGNPTSSLQTNSATSTTKGMMNSTTNNKSSNQSPSLANNPTTQAASNTPLTVRVKRGHVSKACTNCRKMHAACDRARPCSRCVFNKLESSCVDIPRKKRVSRKKPQSSEESSGNNNVQGNGMSDGMKKDQAPQIWSTVPTKVDNIFVTDQSPSQPTASKRMEENGTSAPPPLSLIPRSSSLLDESSTSGLPSSSSILNPSSSSTTSSSTPSSSTSSLLPGPLSIAPDIWTESSFLSPEPLFLSELLAEEEKRIYSTPPSQQSSSTPPSSISFSQRGSMSVKHDPNASASPTMSSSKQQFEIQYLFQEVDRLKDTNNELTSKLVNVTDELNEVKMKVQAMLNTMGTHILIPRELANANTLSALGVSPP